MANPPRSRITCGILGSCLAGKRSLPPIRKEKQFLALVAGAAGKGFSWESEEVLRLKVWDEESKAQKSVLDKHPNWGDLKDLGAMCSRVHSGGDLGSLAHEALGPQPSDHDAEMAGRSGLVYMGTVVKVDDGEDGSGTRLLRTRRHRALIIHELAMAFRDGMLIEGEPGSVKEIQLLRWKDGSSIFKKPTMMAVLRFMHNPEVFSSRFRYDPIITALSTDMPETRATYSILFAIDALELAELPEENIVTHHPDGGRFQEYKIKGYGEGIGDCHANQALLNGQMSGNSTCFKCQMPAPDWYADVFKLPSAVPLKSLSDNQKWSLENGAEGNEYHDLAQLFLNDSETPLSELGLELTNVNADYLLHHRTGIIKILWWALITSSALSAKEKELLRRRFEEVLKKRTWMEYMDGSNWWMVALNWHELTFGFDFLQNKNEFETVVTHIVEMMATVSFDPSDTEEEKESLCFEMYARSICLGALVRDMQERGLFGEGNMSLYLHQAQRHMATDFEKSGSRLREFVTQSFERIFARSKKVAKNQTNRKEVSAQLLETDHYERRAKHRFGRRMSTEAVVSSKLAAWRKSNPKVDLELGEHLFSKYRSEIIPYMKELFALSSYGNLHTRVSDQQEGGSLRFRVNGASPRASPYGELPTPPPPAPPVPDYQ